MTASTRPASPISAAFDARTDIVTYTWTQYQLTTTIDGNTKTKAIVAMTRDDATAYAKKAHTALTAHVAGFSDMQLSMVSCEYSEQLTATADDSEDGDGTPFVREQSVAGVKWIVSSSRHDSGRNFNLEAHDARRACKSLRDWFVSVGC